MTPVSRQPGESRKAYRERGRGAPDSTHPIAVPYDVLMACFDTLSDAEAALRALDDHRAVMAGMSGGGWLPPEQRSPLTNDLLAATEALTPILAADYRARHPEPS